MSSTECSLQGIEEQTYLELEIMAMMVMYTSTMEATNAVPKDTRTTYAPTSCKEAKHNQNQNGSRESRKPVTSLNHLSFVDQWLYPHSERLASELRPVVFGKDVQHLPFPRNLNSSP